MPKTPAAAPPAPDLALVAAYKCLNLYGRTNGMALTVPAPGQAEYGMPIRAEHLSSPNTCHLLKELLVAGRAAVYLRR